jgi:hypothetical protein
VRWRAFFWLPGIWTATRALSLCKGVGFQVSEPRASINYENSSVMACAGPWDRIAGGAAGAGVGVAGVGVGATGSGVGVTPLIIVTSARPALPYLVIDLSAPAPGESVVPRCQWRWNGDGIHERKMPSIAIVRAQHVGQGFGRSSFPQILGVVVEQEGMRIVPGYATDSLQDEYLRTLSLPGIHHLSLCDLLQQQSCCRWRSPSASVGSILPSASHLPGTAGTHIRHHD